MDACPRTSLTTCNLTPLANIRLAAECRSSCGCQWSRPARLQIIAKSRLRFLGSTGVPKFVVKMKPVSVQSSSITSRSSSCRFRCSTSRFTRPRGRFTDRRLLAVFVSAVTRVPPSRLSCRRTETTLAVSSKSCHFRPRASPRRRPVESIREYNASWRCPSSSFRSLCACSKVSVRPSRRCCFGDLERRATFLLTQPHRIP